MVTVKIMQSIRVTSRPSKSMMKKNHFKTGKQKKQAQMTMIFKVMPIKGIWIGCIYVWLVSLEFRQPRSLLLKSSKCYCNGTQTYNHLVCKQTHNHLDKLTSLAKWLNVSLRTKWLWVRVLLQSLKLQISCLFQARNSLMYKQL